MPDYIMPAYGSANAQIAGYLREAVQQGDSWLATQKPAAEYATLMERLSPTDPGRDLLGQSNAQYPKAERLAREIVASLTSFTNVGEITPLSDNALYPQATTLTKLDHHWWRLEETYAALRSIVQSAVSLGTGYGWQTWDSHFYGLYKGDIRLRSVPPSNVTFVQMPADHDMQRAYIVLIREEMPINLARRVYRRTNAAFADALMPDRDAPGWISKGMRKVQEFLSPALRVRGMKPGEHDQDSSFPTVDIYHAYILDDTLNESGQPIEMGAQGTNWAYTVPTLRGPVDTGTINPATNQPFTRPADHADAQLFPLRRYTIFSRTTDIVCYDGSSPWWHGQVPLTRFRFNDWPWEALGRSCVGMIRSMEDSANAILQGIEDSIAVRMDPPALYNDQAVSLNFAEAFNPRRAGSRAAADLSQGKVLDFPVPAENYNIPQWITAHLEWLDDRMEYLTGARDLTAVAKAKQIPAGDAMEKLLEMAGPLTQDMVRGLVLPLQQLGTMRISDYLQFYTYDRIITETNNQGDEEDWLFTPDKLVARQPHDSVGAIRARARKLVTSFKYRVTQSGVTELNRMTTKLFYLQLMKIPDFPIDWWTFSKVAQLPLFGPEPENTNNIVERWIAQKRMLLELQQEFQQGQPGAGGAGGPSPLAPSGPNPKGRPPTNKGAARIISKDGGARSTVATS